MEQEALLERAARELRREQSLIVKGKQTLYDAAKQVQKEHEINALNVAMAEHRVKEEEITADEAYVNA